MTIQYIKQNIERMGLILDELNKFNYTYLAGKEDDRLIAKETANSLIRQFRILNNAIPELVKNIPIFKPMKNDKRELKKLARLSYTDESKTKKFVIISEDEKRDYMKEFHLSIMNLKKRPKMIGDEEILMNQPNFYVKISNKIFSETASRILAKYKFVFLKNSLRKSNIPYMLNSYIAMAVLTSVIIGVLGIIIFILFLFLNVQEAPPFVSFGRDSLPAILLKVVVVFGLPILTMLGFYYYPFTEEKGLGKKIEQELPFVVIHMAAVGSSGVNPLRIFAILAKEKEYPYARVEMRKIVNKVNLYGLDIVTALKDSAKDTASTKLAELFNGLANNISTGGDIADFLDKRSESLLFDYRLEREKYTRTV
ncbi:MAG: type II secretion system F family protein, partial [Nanoarchaeota archaeon]